MRLFVKNLMVLLLLCCVLGGAALAEEDYSFFDLPGMEEAAPEQGETTPLQEAPGQDQADPPAQEEEEGQDDFGADEGFEAPYPDGQEAFAQAPEGSLAGVWTYPIPLEVLLAEGDYIRLVNRENLLDSSYKPSDLEEVKVRKYKAVEIKMRAEANAAMTEMFADAEIQGVTLYAHSGYRSYQTQATMYENRLKDNDGVDDGYVQYPGASDHQTGLGIDIIDKGTIGKRFSRSFEGTKEAQWMAAHCWEYGFIIRYPKGAEDITGIEYEPWHLRYVGLDAAAYIMNNNLTLEEFTQQWQTALSQYDASLLQADVGG